MAMSTCQSCGASIASSDVVCRYCGAPHAAGIAHERAERQRRESEIVALATQQHYARTQADIVVRRTSRQALVWSLAALPLCCVPVPGVVGLVLALRARKLAEQHRLHLPGQCVAALAFSIVSFLACVSLYTFVVLDSRALATRRENLRAQVETLAEASTLGQTTACALVELWLLDNQYEGHSWSTSDHFDCPGKLEQRDDRATLFDVHIRRSSEQAFVVVGCLKRGARWMVQDLRRGNSCTEVPSPVAAETEEAAPSASQVPVVSSASGPAAPLPLRSSRSAPKPVTSTLRPRPSAGGAVPAVSSPTRGSAR